MKIRVIMRTMVGNEEKFDLYEPAVVFAEVPVLLNFVAHILFLRLYILYFSRVCISLSPITEVDPRPDDRSSVGLVSYTVRCITDV